MSISHPTIPTVAGRPTTSETYLKLIHHLREVQSLCAVMSHLHRTEEGNRERLLSRGWLGIAEMMKMVEAQISQLAQGKLLS